MRYLFGFLCVCALGVMPLVGCSDTQPGCETGADCNDDNECTSDVCNPTTSACDYSTVADGTACSDGVCLDGVCTALARVSGTVTLSEIDGDSPAVAATVSVLDTLLSATTDELGTFSFDVPVGIVFLQSSQEDTWGTIKLETVPPAGQSDLELRVFADTFAELLAQDLMFDLDDTKGVVEVNFDPPSGLGGETATLNEPHGPVSTEDAVGNDVLSEALLFDGGEELTFFNANLTEELIVIPKGVNGVNRCDLEDPGTVYPVVAKFVTDVDVVCTAP